MHNNNGHFDQFQGGHFLLGQKFRDYFHSAVSDLPNLPVKHLRNYGLRLLTSTTID